MSLQLFPSNSRTLVVSDKYRTNPLSHQPGGYTVKVYYSSGFTRVYDKIKNVEAYTKYMKGKFDVLEIEVIN